MRRYFCCLFLPLQLFAQDIPVKVLEGFQFTEGPAVARHGRLFFTDVRAQQIISYIPETGEHTVYMEHTGGANGLYYKSGILYACAGKARSVIAIDSLKNITVLARTFEGKKLNSPNDLWVDKQSGIYFTDPRYGNQDGLEQDGMHVYYLHPGYAKITRIINDLTRPNGIVGSRDGKRLYVVDEGQRKTFVYDITDSGQVKNKQLFCDAGIDGMSITDAGNICITTGSGVAVYAPNGDRLRLFTFGGLTTNTAYHAGKLFVTTQSGELWKIEINH